MKLRDKRKRKKYLMPVAYIIPWKAMALNLLESPENFKEQTNDKPQPRPINSESMGVGSLRQKVLNAPR